MLRRLRLTNFKRFTEDTFDLAALTVLTGLNASGKSSLLQSLLLASAAHRSKARYVGLNDERSGLRLGGAIDVLAAGASDSRIGIDVRGRGWSRLTLLADDGVTDDVVQVESRSEADSLASLCDLTYLSAERTGPRVTSPVAPMAEGVHGVGVDGRFTAWVLATSGRREVDVALRLGQSVSPLLSGQVEAWMSHLLGTLEIDAEIAPRTNIATLKFRHDRLGDWMLPPNTGFGISYLLPLVVSMLTSAKGDLVIIDSPEAHLHPSAQSRLGQFLALVSSAGRQVIVETHSDHLLNGVRRAVASSSTRSRDVLIHFFDGQGHQPIQISENASIARWPEGFFDQSRRDLAEIVRKREA